ncbi:MAG: AI-2E family transporter [Anaerolineae bacterium]|nr:AI-2E family transporter [Anaerolineae bacterium]
MKIQCFVKDRDPDVQRFVHFNHEVRQYMSITAGLGFLASTLEVALLMILGIEFAVLWGVFSFFMSFVPQIGIYVAIIPPAIMAFVQFGTLEMLSVIVGYLVIDGIINRSIKRSYFQRRLNISIPVVFVSLVLWTWALGSIGAILAVPIAMLVQALLASREETLWMVYLFGGGQDLYVPDAPVDDIEADGG